MTTTLLACALALAVGVAVSDTTTASTDHATRTATINLDADVATVFPLFGFIEEKKWSRGWDPKIVVLGDSLQDSVFTYSHDGLTATWIVTEYDEARHQVTYAVFVPDNRAMTIRIACAPDGPKARAQVTYTFTALGEHGRTALHEFEQQDFARRILHWQHAINHYLKTGKQWKGDSH